MKLEDFKLWERGVSNDWAIKITKSGLLYRIQHVLECDCKEDSVVFGEDAIENMNLDMFVAMWSNKGFLDFLSKWGSALKASDTNNYVLENISNHNGRIILFNKEENVINFLDKIKLGEPRYNGWDQERDVDRVQDVLNDNGVDTSINMWGQFLDNNTKNEENTSWEQCTSNE